jgi:hypothetical protein
MTAYQEGIKALKLKEGDLIEIHFKQSNNTTHVSLPVYFMSLDTKENTINYAKEKYYTGGIITFDKKHTKSLSELEEVVKKDTACKVRDSVIKL